MALIEPTQRTLRDGTPCLLRCAEEADAAALLGFDEENAREYAFTIHAPDEVDRDLDTRRKKILEFRRRPNWLMLAAVCGGASVGAVSFRGGVTRRTQHHGTLGISVSGPWRRRGVGRILVTALLDWAERHPQIVKVNLLVFEGNGPAIALYRSLGFCEEGRRVAEIGLGDGRYADDLLMARFVKPVTRGARPDGTGAGNRP